jgi:hypothetical protein
MLHVILEKSFDRWDAKKHPRAPRGSEIGGQFASSKLVALSVIANDTAKRQLGFDGEVVVHPDGEDYDLKVGVLNLKAGATYSASANRIEVYASSFIGEADIQAFLPGLMAHEVQHARFQAVRKAMLEERDVLMKDPRTKKDMRADGTLETLGAEYPIHQAFTEFNNKYKFTDLQKNDGVSAYSEAYWEPEALAMNGGTGRAADETLAEIARLRHEQGAGFMKKVAKPWREYYALQMRVYEGLRK